MCTVESALLRQISVRRMGIKDTIYNISEIPWSNNQCIYTESNHSCTHTISKFLSLIKLCVYWILIFRLTSDLAFWYFSESSLGEFYSCFNINQGSPFSTFDSQTYKLNLLTIFGTNPHFLHITLQKTTESRTCPILSSALVLCQSMRHGLTDK